MRLIVQKQVEKIHQVLASGEGRNDGFLGGRLGLCFYYYHGYKVLEEKPLADRAGRLLDEVFDNLNSGNPRLAGSALSNGGAGLGYAINFLEKEGLIEFEVEKEFAGLDKYLFKTALSQIEEDCIDYLHGGMGAVLYFSERKPSVLIQHYLDTLVAKVCGRAVEEEAGTWFRNYMLKNQDKEDINFSLSHGLTGILLILIKAYERSTHKDLIRQVVANGVRFILRHKMDVDYDGDVYSFFPLIIRHGTKELFAPGRLAWCYGDLNEVLLLYRAGKLLDDKNMLKLADLMGTQTLLRKESKSTLVKDTHFCHGTAGLAQFYKTLFRESQVAAYADGYEYWIEQTVLLLDNDLEKGFYTGKECDYLEGLVGVAFTLLSYISDKELRWSESLLL